MSFTPIGAKQLEDVEKSIVTVINNAATVSERNTTRMLKALDDHAKALTEATKSSDKAADQLVKATFALVVATLLLVIVGVIQALILLKSPG